MYKHWTDLIKPKQLELEEKTLTSTYGKFYAEPFEVASVRPLAILCGALCFLH